MLMNKIWWQCDALGLQGVEDLEALGCRQGFQDFADLEVLSLCVFRVYLGFRV